MMNYNIRSEEIARAAAELSGQFGFALSREGIPVDVEEGAEEAALVYDKGRLLVCVRKRVQIFYALRRFAELCRESVPAQPIKISLNGTFHELCYMLDCSRNAVPREETLFSLIRHLAVLGYDSFGLYMEDTFRVEGYPYFGYLRTPFTAEQLRRTDAYCKLFGIELIPFIQTLAHFNTLIRHYAMADLFDVNDILLVGEQKTYDFIEALIATCASCFSSRRMNIGMDEAYMLGRGKYMDLHGARDRFDIMAEHLEKVIGICKKYGFSPMMWSDMFFSLTMNGQYAEGLPPEVIQKVPEGVELIYWDYCSTDEAHYDAMIRKHRAFPNEIGFAGGAWKWLGYTPDNRYAFASCEAAARACVKEGVEHFIVTGWGDNGADCSVFATLPSLYACSCINAGEPLKGERFEAGFELFAGMPFDAFMTVDLCNRLTDHDDVEEKNSANKYLLFNDVLLGTLDTTVEEGLGERYAAHARALLAAERQAGKWSYLFETQRRLAEVLEIKSEIGIRLRAAYQQGDREALRAECGRLKELCVRVDAFYRALLAQWERENMPHGFDVQDLRIGALERRLHSAIRKTEAYLAGEVGEIPELGEELLCFMGHGTEFEKDLDQCEWRWRRMSSVNVNE